MPGWDVIYALEFEPEYEALAESVQDELVAHLIVLEQNGPQLGRPLVDTLAGSKHANMKELRFSIGKETWRFAFAFDSKGQAVVLAGGDKTGQDQKRFYKRLIKVADDRFSAHLVRLKEGDGT